jgi:hypothetical protein
MAKQMISRAIAICSIAILLFAQMAATAYACAGINGAAGFGAAIAADAAMHEAMPGCEMNKGNQNLNLCLQHCQAGDQSVQTLPHIPVPALAAIPSLIIVEPAVVLTSGELQRKTAWSVVVPLPPPLARFGVLRI